MTFWPALSKGQSLNHFQLLVVELRTRSRLKLKAEVNHERGEGVVAKDHLGLVLSWLRDQQEEVLDVVDWDIKTLADRQAVKLKITVAVSEASFTGDRAMTRFVPVPETVNIIHAHPAIPILPYFRPYAQSSAYGMPPACHMHTCLAHFACSHKPHKQGRMLRKDTRKDASLAAGQSYAERGDNEVEVSSPKKLAFISVLYAFFPRTGRVKMVAITVSVSGKPTINLDFANKHPRDVTIKELKAAIHAKFPKVIQTSRHESSSPHRSLVLAHCKQTKNHRS